MDTLKTIGSYVKQYLIYGHVTRTYNSDKNSTDLICFGNLRMEERFPELKNDVLRYEKPFFERRKPFLQTTSVPFLVVLGAVLVRS